MNLQKNEKGIALILALLIITLLFVMAVEFNYKASVDITIAANIRDATKALYTAKSGLNATIALLKRDDNDYDAFSEDWGRFAELSKTPFLYSQYIDEGAIQLRIIDECSKIDVNQILVDDSPSLQQLKALFILFDIDVDTTDAIMDWIDTDHNIREMGAEDDYYQGLENPYPCKDAPIEIIEELLMIREITEDHLYGTKVRKGIKDYITVHSKGKININTADSIVFQTLGYIEEDEWITPIDGETARTIIEKREEEPFENIIDLSKVSGMGEIYEKIKGQITVESHFFSVDVEATVNKAQKRIKTIIERERKGGENSMKIVYWAVE
ncbi:MAG: type II secretion system minor pseudopilin GspK [Thermodesulfobacteriota bacterium]|nr:type II secretion system minor pseudopilin GspK [Thermodesulfobacteriota bacterium]